MIDLDAIVARLADEAATAEAERRVEVLKKATPVRTGRTRKAWKVDQSGGKLAIVNDTPYATGATRKIRPLIRAIAAGDVD